MRNLGLLNVKRLVEQPLRAVLAVVAIAAGTSLLVGVVIDRASVERSLGGFVDQRAGRAELEVHGPGGPAGLEESVLPKVRSVPGVEAAAPIVQVVTIVETEAGDERYVAAFGVDCSIEAVLGEFGCDEATLTGFAGAYETSPSLVRWAGDRGVVRTDVGRLPITNGLPVDELDEMNHGGIVVFPLAEAQRLFGHEDALTSVLIVPEPGVDLETLRADLEVAAGPQNVVSEPGSIGGDELAQMLLMFLLLMSVFGLAVGAQLVHNTTALSLEERRRDLAVMGALGAPPRTILAGTLVEAGVIGLVGGLAGIGGGMLVARPLVQSMSDTLDEVTGLQISVHVTPGAIVIGLLLGMLTSIVAAIGPARRAARMDVAAELHGQARRGETGTARRGRRAAVYAGLALLGMALAFVGQRDGAIEPWQPLAAYAGFGMTAVLSFRAAQHGAAPLLALVQRLPFLRNGTARLALTSLGGEPKRTGVMVLALSIAVGVGVVLGNTNASIVAGSDETTERLAGGTLWVGSTDPNNTLSVAARLSPEVVADIRAMDGVQDVIEDVGFCGDHPVIGSFCVDNENGDLNGPTILRGRSSEAEAFAHGEVMIGTGMARAHQLDPGDEITIPGRTGLRAYTVGAVWLDPNNTGRSVAVPQDVFEDLYGARQASALNVVPEPGVSLAELDARIEAADLDPDLMSMQPEELADSFKESIGGFVTPFAALQRGMLAVALIAVTSTLLLVGVQRRREHGLLMAIGMAPEGLGRMVVTEAAIVGLTAGVVGTLAGLGTYVAMMWVSPLLTGLAAPFRFDAMTPLVYVYAGLLFVIVGASVPAWRTARLDPATALRYE